MNKTKLKLSEEVIYPGIIPSPLLTGRGVFIEVSPAHSPTTQELGRKKKTDLKLNIFLLVFMQRPKQWK